MKPRNHAYLVQIARYLRDHPLEDAENIFKFNTNLYLELGSIRVGCGVNVMDPRAIKACIFKYIVENPRIYTNSILKQAAEQII